MKDVARPRRNAGVKPAHTTLHRQSAPTMMATGTPTTDARPPHESHKIQTEAPHHDGDRHHHLGHHADLAREVRGVAHDQLGPGHLICRERGGLGNASMINQ
jgi:hypothetical protein